eukprot:gene30789-37197_t
MDQLHVFTVWKLNEVCNDLYVPSDSAAMFREGEEEELQDYVKSQISASSLVSSTIVCVVREPPLEGSGGAQLLSLNGGLKAWREEESVNNILRVREELRDILAHPDTYNSNTNADAHSISTPQPTAFSPSRPVQGIAHVASPLMPSMPPASPVRMSKTDPSSHVPAGLTQSLYAQLLASKEGAELVKQAERDRTDHAGNGSVTASESGEGLSDYVQRVYGLLKHRGVEHALSNMRESTLGGMGYSVASMASMTSMSMASRAVDIDKVIYGDTRASAEKDSAARISVASTDNMVGVSMASIAAEEKDVDKGLARASVTSVAASMNMDRDVSRMNAASTSLTSMPSVRASKVADSSSIMASAERSMTLGDESMASLGRHSAMATSMDTSVIDAVRASAAVGDGKDSGVTERSVTASGSGSSLPNNQSGSPAALHRSIGVNAEGERHVLPSDTDGVKNSRGYSDLDAGHGDAFESSEEEAIEDLVEVLGAEVLSHSSPLPVPPSLTHALSRSSLASRAVAGEGEPALTPPLPPDPALPPLVSYAHNPTPPVPTLPSAAELAVPIPISTSMSQPAAVPTAWSAMLEKMRMLAEGMEKEKQDRLMRGESKRKRVGEQALARLYNNSRNHLNPPSTATQPPVPLPAQQVQSTHAHPHPQALVNAAEPVYNARPAIFPSNNEPAPLAAVHSAVVDVTPAVALPMISPRPASAGVAAKVQAPPSPPQGGLAWQIDLTVNTAAAVTEGAQGAEAARPRSRIHARPTSVQRRAAPAGADANADANPTSPRDKDRDRDVSAGRRPQSRLRGGAGGERGAGHTNYLPLKNALIHVCLAGTHQEEKREEVLELLDFYMAGKPPRCGLQALSEVLDSPLHVEWGGRVAQCVLMFYKAKNLAFKAVYAVSPNPDDEKPLQRVYGKGPLSLPNDKIKEFLKFETSSKAFKPLPVKTLSSTVDGVVLEPATQKSSRVL